MTPLPAPTHGLHLVAPAVLPPLEAARLLRPALRRGAVVACAPNPLVVSELRRLLGPQVRLLPAPDDPWEVDPPAPVDPAGAALGLLLLRLKEASVRELRALSGLGRRTIRDRLARLWAHGCVVRGPDGGFRAGRGLVKTLASALRLPAAGFYRLGPGRPGLGAHRHLARMAGELAARSWGVDAHWVYWPEPRLGRAPRLDGLGWVGGVVLGVEVDRRHRPAPEVAAALVKRARWFFARFAEHPAVLLVFTRPAVLPELRGRVGTLGLRPGRGLLAVGLRRFGGRFRLPPAPSGGAVMVEAP